MSRRLKVRFVRDMPPSSVEVVGPDFSTVGRLWLSPGDQKAVDVPSEDVFLRVHLASGESITIKDPGNLDRTVGVADLLARRTRSRTDTSASLRPLTRRQAQRRAGGAVPRFGADAFAVKTADVALEGGLKVKLVGDNDIPQVGEIGADGTAAVFERPSLSNRCLLTLRAPGTRVQVGLPGSAVEITVRSSELHDGQRIASVRVKTSSATADTLAAYLHRGDLYAASSMTDWAERAKDLLEGKSADPFAAAVGAYLLLRLRKIDSLHDWTQKLMLVSTTTDAVLIRAWHLIYRRGDEDAIRQLLARAVSGSLPIFSEGLRLLSDGARILGVDSEQAVGRLNSHARRALSRSPFTATLDPSESAVRVPWEFDIDYASSV